MANDYVPDYEDYQTLVKKRKDVNNYYTIAKNLRDQLTEGGLEHQYCEELLRKTTYNVGQNSGSWSGKDAETYAETARDICSKLREAEKDYIKSLQDIMDYCDKEAERLQEWITETKEKMDAGAKVLHFVNAGLLGKNDG